MSPDPAALTPATITSAHALEDLADEWHALWTRCRGATPFQSPRWLLPWWHTFESGELRVFVLRRDRDLAGIVPLYAAAADDSDTRVLRLLGSGNSDYLDALFEPGLEARGMQMCWRKLDRRRDGWDRCDLLELRARSPLLAAPAPAAWNDEIAQGSTCSVVPLDPRDPDAALPRGFAKKLRYFARLAERSGGVRIERADETTFADAFAALVRLHGARRASRGEAGVLADPAVRSFHREAARGLLGSGVLRLYTLYVGEQAAASTYGFLHGGRAYCYLTGFDPELSHLSPGHLVLHHAMREAAREGALAFDLLRGEETYKARWQAVPVANVRRTLSPGRAVPRYRAQRPSAFRVAL